MSTGQKPKPKNPSNLKPFLLFLKGYLPLTLLMLIVSASASLISLFLPSKIGQLIDSYKIQGYQGVGSDYYFLGGVVVGVFLLSLIQVYFSNFFAEKIAFDLRKSIMTKVADQSYQYVNEVGSSSLITAVTSDVDNTKFVISNGIVAVLTSIILLVGSSTVMLITNLRLGLIAVGTLPFIFIAFGLIFSRIGKLFGLIQANTTKLNQVISESVYAAALVRVMNSKGWEMQKFQIFNQKAKELTYRIVFLFSALFPAINLITNSAIVAIIWFGGRGIVESQISGINQFTVGGLSAFLSYYTLLITPVFILGFTSQAISRGLVSFGNIQKIIQSTTTEHLGMYQGLVKGNILVQDLTLTLAGKDIIKDFNFEIKPGSRTAILGPTAAGKSQLFGLLSGLNSPTSGSIKVDGVDLAAWSQESYLSQMGLVFQDSIVFNSSIHDNIAFDSSLSDAQIQKAIQTSTFDEVIKDLSGGIDTIVSERGNNLSGGQKQRLMLARALAGEPKILLLDDFTARVDTATEQRIWNNITANYPDITIISITQKVEGIKDFDLILVIEEGELVGQGTHQELIQTCHEYQLISKSQEILN